MTVKMKISHGFDHILIIVERSNAEGSIPAEPQPTVWSKKSQKNHRNQNEYL